MLEEFMQKIVGQLAHRLRQIHLPLLEPTALRHVLKTYTGVTLIDKLRSLDCYPLPIGHDPCVWQSTGTAPTVLPSVCVFYSVDILIKMICSLTDDLLQKLRQDDLSSYTKLEYLLVSYFGQIELVPHLPSRSSFSPKCRLHVIDWDQAPKFASERAFQSFRLSKPKQLNGDVEALKDRLLLDLPRPVSSLRILTMERQ